MNNFDYAQIERMYDRIRSDNHAIETKNKEYVDMMCPRISEIDRQISATMIRRAKEAIGGCGVNHEAIKSEIESLRLQRDTLVAEYGLEDYLLPVYTCEDCKDTGYISGGRCECFRRYEIKFRYGSTNIKNLNTSDNFSKFNLEFYPDFSDDPTIPTANQLAKKALAVSMNFVKNFGNIDGWGIFLYGEPGTGKTFLTNCIVNALIKEHSVIYLTAVELFDIMSDCRFKGADKSSEERLLDCELLVIDDLGTEIMSAFIDSALFRIVNDRMLTKKSTIISSNLSPAEILERYRERIFSRIVSRYHILKLSTEDIRIRKRTGR